MRRKNIDNLFKDNHFIKLEDVFSAYFDCRKNKRNKLDALEFELDFETELIKLWEDINSNKYEVKPLDVFISERPVKREIFAAQFRDRVVHHLVINKLENIFEKEFIYDSYSCRKGKGTHFGIKRVKKMMRSCSKNYKKDCFVLKLDIQGYFMSINKDILLEKLKNFINEKYKEKDKEKVVWLCEKIINKDCIKDCKIRSPKNKWRGLPKSKSLFYAHKRCGLPIGNYTNQVFANFYLNSFDHFIKHNLKIKYYARYVDDFLIFSERKNELINIMGKTKDFINDELNLTLHPRKIYLQNISKGFEFLGVFIKPWRSYITPRVKNNFWISIEEINEKLKDKGWYEKNEKQKILFKINSHLGVLNHCNTYNLKKKILDKLRPEFWKCFETGEGFIKVILKNRVKTFENK